MEHECAIGECRDLDNVKSMSGLRYSTYIELSSVSPQGNRLLEKG
jgi:hypothetical protein